MWQILVTALQMRGLTSRNSDSLSKEIYKTKFYCLVSLLNMVVVVKDQISLLNSFLFYIVIVAKKTNL